jgi:hypothetical protein
MITMHCSEYATSHMFMWTRAVTRVDTQSCFIDTERLLLAINTV